SCLSCQMGNSFSARSHASVRDNHHGYYLVLEETKQRELLQKVSQLKLGDSRREAINRLGPPTFDRADVTKEGRFIGRTVVYYLTCLSVLHIYPQRVGVPPTAWFVCIVNPFISRTFSVRTNSQHRQKCRLRVASPIESEGVFVQICLKVFGG